MPMTKPELAFVETTDLIKELQNRFTSFAIAGCLVESPDDGNQKERHVFSYHGGIEGAIGLWHLFGSFLTDKTREVLKNMGKID